jgi:hypothetical protein
MSQGLALRAVIKKWELVSSFNFPEGMGREGGGRKVWMRWEEIGGVVGDG